MNLAYVLVVSVASSLGAEARDDQRAPAPPEMEVLRRLVGSWTIEIEGVTPEQTRRTTTERRQLTLGGHYLQARAFDEKGELASITIYTYHVATKQYRVWEFGSTGLAEDFTGKWDPATQTLTFTGDVDDDGTWTYTLRFLDRKNTQGELIVKDTDGNVAMNARIKATRQPRKPKKPKPPTSASSGTPSSEPT